MDRLRAFEVFVAVVSKQGFARAAEALDTSPANVTRYIAELEAHLGARLLNRHSRKLSLTESGEALYERARTVLDDVAEAEALASTATMQPRGRLRINAPLSFGILHLAPLWPQFRQRHPEVCQRKANQLGRCHRDRIAVVGARVKAGFGHKAMPHPLQHQCGALFVHALQQHLAGDDEVHEPGLLPLPE